MLYLQILEKNITLFILSNKLVGGITNKYAEYLKIKTVITICHYHFSDEFQV